MGWFTDGGVSNICYLWVAKHILAVKS